MLFFSSAQGDLLSICEVGPRKDKNHNGNSQCSKVLTLYQKNPLSTNKPPCLNVYFKMKIKLKAFVLNAQIPLSFLNPLSWKTLLNFLTKPSIVIQKQFPSTQTGFTRSFLHCRIVREGFFPEGVKGRERYHWFQRRKIFYCVCSSFMRQFALLKTAFFNTNTLTLSKYAWNMVCPAHLASVDEFCSVDQICYFIMLNCWWKMCIDQWIPPLNSE